MAGGRRRNERRRGVRAARLILGESAPLARAARPISDFQNFVLD
jgi:hypothetical protein